MTGVNGHCTAKTPSNAGHEDLEGLSPRTDVKTTGINWKEADALSTDSNEWRCCVVVVAQCIYAV